MKPFKKVGSYLKQPRIIYVEMVEMIFSTLTQPLRRTLNLFVPPNSVYT